MFSLLILYGRFAIFLSLFGFIFLALSRYFEKKQLISTQTWVNFSRVGLLLGFFALLIPVKTKLAPIPSANLFSAPTMKGNRVEQNVIGIERENKHEVLAWDPNFLEALGGLLLGGLILFGLGSLLKEERSLRKLLRRSLLIKQIGRVSLYSTENLSVPLGFRLFPKAYVLIPDEVWQNRSELNYILRHEIQHHRQQDTAWIWALEFIKKIFFWNPLILKWAEETSIFHEFACDEAVLTRRMASRQAYGHLLVKMAENLTVNQASHAGTTCAALDLSSSNLKRRILMMMNNQRHKGSKLTTYCLALAMVSLVGITSFATQFSIQDRRITKEQAEAVADNLRKDGYPITLNESVLKELNRYVGTPDGREYIKNSLYRMQSYEGMVTDTFSSYQVPLELKALAIMESGYQNLPAIKNPVGAAGVWQFMAQTARNYGLRVDTKIDERMNMEKETDAAARLLRSLFLRFRNWETAVLAYNAGENKVQSGITKLGTTDAWKLIQGGFGGDEGYVPKITAAVLIVKSPEWIE